MMDLASLLDCSLPTVEIGKPPSITPKKWCLDMIAKEWDCDPRKLSQHIKTNTKLTKLLKIKFTQKGKIGPGSYESITLQAIEEAKIIYKTILVNENSTKWTLTSVAQRMGYDRQLVSKAIKASSELRTLLRVELDSKNVISRNSFCGITLDDVIEAERIYSARRYKWCPKYNLDGCRKCKSSEKRHHGHGYCASCLHYKHSPPPKNKYWSVRLKLTECADCKTSEQPHHCYGKCRPCFNVWRRVKKNVLWAPRLRLTKCKDCKSDEIPHYGRGKCKRCYARWRSRKLRKKKKRERKKKVTRLSVSSPAYYLWLES